MGAAGIASSGPRRGRRRGRRAMMSEINVTPFVDVMLVLLIIFMVATPLMTPGIDVNLPESDASALPSVSEEPLTVTIAADGRVAIQGSEVARADLVARLSAIVEQRESAQIYLRADGANSWAEVADVMGVLNGAGFTDIGLVTAPRSAR